MDKIVFDIETKNTFQDVGGQANVKLLDVSFVGAYSYNQDKYLSFFEQDLEQLDELFRTAGVIIGFGLTRFDIPVLDKYLKLNLYSVPHIDILDAIEMATGKRISLNLLAQTNVGLEKTADGLKAIEFYKNGQLKELEEYCLQDVRVTKEVYDLAVKQGYLLVPDKFTGVKTKVPLSFDEGDLSTKQSLF